MPKLVAKGLTEEQFKQLKGGSDLFQISRPAIKTTRQGWPESSSSVFSQLLFGYVSPLLALGAIEGRTLSNGDLYEVPKAESSSVLSATLRSHYHPGEAGGDQTDDGAMWKLIWGLWALVKPLMIEAGWSVGPTSIV